MKQCDCIAQTITQLKEKLGVDSCGIDNLELISGRTFSTFSYEKIEGKRKRRKQTYILHSYCPFCGRPYEREEAKNHG